MTKKLFIYILFAVALTSCHSAGNDAYSSNLWGGDENTENVKASGGFIAEDQESEDLAAYKEEISNYGKLFREIMDEIDSAFDIFDDYVDGGSDYADVSFANDGNGFAQDFGGNDGYNFF